MENVENNRISDGNMWQPDILGDGFEMRYISQPDDYSGTVRTTVIRKLTAGGSAKAVLYVHGFSDYFFQAEMADMFVGHGYDFYAVDLRKYGRSLLPGQKMFQVRDISEYFADIDKAVGIIAGTGVSEIVLLGHSTGGLTSALYMAGRPSPLIKAVILNSPFLDWNMPWFLKKIVVPVVSLLGKFLPDIKVRQKPDPGYAHTLSKDYGGEWDYNKSWKPDVMPDPDMGWVRAIQRAQQRLRRSIVKVPVLLMHSSESVRPGDDKEKYSRADAILDVDTISRYGRRLGPDVTEVTFPGALHDLALSRPSVRQAMYSTMLGWLKNQGL